MDEACGAGRIPPFVCYLNVDQGEMLMKSETQIRAILSEKGCINNTCVHFK